MLKFLLFILTPYLMQAEEPRGFTYKEPILISEGEDEKRGDLATTLENSSRFNYYENQSLRSFSSVFVGGVDQRFFEVHYNGFSLRDPSSTTGVFNMASLAALRSSRLSIAGGAGIDLVSAETDRGYIEAGISNLEEFELSGEYRSCNLSHSCTAVEAVVKRGGGFSQTSGGSEDDFYQELALSASKSLQFGEGRKLTSRLLYYGQILDLDSLLPQSVVVDESKAAEALNSVLFLGQDFEIAKKHKLMLSYTQSYRNQRDPVPEDPNLNLSFRQRGEVLELVYQYNKKLNLKVFNERFDLYSSSGLDSGFQLSKLFSFGDLILDLSLGKTKLRSYDWLVELGYKNLVLFYKGLPPSLFQQKYNDEFSPILEKLNAQEFIGVRQSGVHKVFGGSIKWNWSYSRIYRFVDFDSPNNSYENLGEVEHYFMGVALRRGPLQFFVQNQIAREVQGDKNDLPRRAPWTLGLRSHKKLFKHFILSSGLKWLSKRKAFDQSDLEPTWMSDLKLSYKNIHLTCTNVLSKNDTVFKNLGRRPLTVRLSFQKNF